MVMASSLTVILRSHQVKQGNTRYTEPAGLQKTDHRCSIVESSSPAMGYLHLYNVPLGHNTCKRWET